MAAAVPFIALALTAGSTVGGLAMQSSANDEQKRANADARTKALAAADQQKAALKAQQAKDALAEDKASQAALMAARSRQSDPGRALMNGTVTTSPLGVPGAAPTTGKTLLGL